MFYNVIEAKIKITEDKMGGNRAIEHHWGQRIESGWVKVKISRDEHFWKEIRLAIWDWIESAILDTVQKICTIKLDLY